MRGRISSPVRADGPAIGVVAADVAVPAEGVALGLGHVLGQVRGAVGVDVGGPATYAAGSEPDDPTGAALLAIDGVTSVFMTADFVTLSKVPDAAWETIAPMAAEILEERFGG